MLLCLLQLQDQVESGLQLWAALSVQKRLICQGSLMLAQRKEKGLLDTGSLMLAWRKEKGLRDTGWAGESHAQNPH